MAHENLSNQVLRCHVLQHPLIWYANQILNTGDDSWLDQTYWFDPSVSIMVSIKIVLFLQKNAHTIFLLLFTLVVSLWMVITRSFWISHKDDYIEGD